MWLMLLQIVILGPGLQRMCVYIYIYIIYIYIVYISAWIFEERSADMQVDGDFGIGTQ